MSAQHYRYLYTNVPLGRFHFGWDAIRHDSFVYISACQERSSSPDPRPQRWLGDSVIHVASINPQDGGVEFVLAWAAYGGFGVTITYPINVWVDITVFDPKDPWGQS